MRSHEKLCSRTAPKSSLWLFSLGLFDYEQLCQIFSGGLVEHMAMSCRHSWPPQISICRVVEMCSSLTLNLALIYLPHIVHICPYMSIYYSYCQLSSIFYHYIHLYSQNQIRGSIISAIFGWHSTQHFWLPGSTPWFDGSSTGRGCGSDTKLLTSGGLRQLVM